MDESRLIKAAASEAANKVMNILTGRLAGNVEKAIKDAAAQAARTGAEVGARAALEAAEKERKKFRQERYDKRYRNTKLLLKNYNMLSQHCSGAVYDAASEVVNSQEGEDGTESVLEMLEEMLDDDVHVESIMKTAARTQIIMEHVNNMLKIYRIYCKNSKKEEDKRHYRVIKAVYLDPSPCTPMEIAAEEHIDKRTVYKDIDAACETLSALIFGIDGIRG